MFTPHQVSHVRYQVSCVTCHGHMSRVTCQVSCVRCHMSYKVVKLVSGGSVINGAYPVQFSEDEQKPKPFFAHPLNSQTLNKESCCCGPSNFLANNSFSIDIPISATLKDTPTQPLVFHRGCLHLFVSSWGAQVFPTMKHATKVATSSDSGALMFDLSCMRMKFFV